MTKDDRYGATDDDYGDDYGEYSETESKTVAESGTGDSKSESSNAGGNAETNGNAGADTLPFIFARRTVKADREAMPVYVQDTTAGEISDLERELSQRFDGDKVMALDVREALMRAGLENMDDVQRVMEEWGYGRR
ncbi:hypothetical protein SAMN05421858_3850 [Haladaptatus litoreus]|uniref:Uncharacterized protein n=1 Tax=Haladaptatus litoreus TaxID=553468 RepID=A0A1N7DYC6_9EURY|nr:hypothetical protein [Haladaptatus litoreus]SIR80776.1 hypothetical protein SAMN05421858_3850 [Haladaptatus litoreus]